jgi:hypothetical protein
MTKRASAGRYGTGKIYVARRWTDPDRGVPWVPIVRDTAAEAASEYVRTCVRDTPGGVTFVEVRSDDRPRGALFRVEQRGGKSANVYVHPVQTLVTTASSRAAARREIAKAS